MPAAAEAYVWWEGENPAATNFPAVTQFSASTFSLKRELLSGRDWLSNAGLRSGPEAFARYSIEVPAPGKYFLWSRKFWKHGPFRWRFDRTEWRICPADVPLADSTYIREYLCANWVFLGEVELGAGRHDFELRLLAGEGEALTAAFDCFVLMTGRFVPRGRLRPGEKSGSADTGRFAWEPETDPFGGDCLLDLRAMNEKYAGEHGWIGRDGADFKRGDGQKIRFWGVNVGGEIAEGESAAVEYLARRLAKVGVNLVRIHCPLWDNRRPEEVEAGRLANIMFLVGALKKQGIYTSLSFYFPLWAEITPAYRIDGYEDKDNRHPFGLLFFNPRMRQLYRGWVRALLDTRNPHTGLKLGQDPAVAMVEIQNEDSLFFWTFSKENLAESEWEKLERLYGAWLLERYGSASGTQAAWMEAREPEDDLESGRAVLYGAWRMTRDGLKRVGPGMRRRVGDQVRFLAGVQREFYGKTADYLRNVLKVRSLLVASNWVTADPELLEALEHYSYAACDVLDRHGYFECRHEGEGSGYSVRVGHTFVNASVLRDPESLPVQAFQMEGMPQYISELGWPNPNLYRTEWPFLAAAYGALQGIDAIGNFAVGSNDWETSMGKFSLSTPAVLGSFPACALLYRRGYVSEAGDAVRQVLALEGLFRLKGSGGFAAQALDELRKTDGGNAAAEEETERRIDPLAFFTGKVSRSVGRQDEGVWQADLSGCIDRQGRKIKSLTRELIWDYRMGILELRAPRAQGAAGFLSQVRSINLGNVEIESNNEYSTVLAVSWDGRPLAESALILVQAVTTERPFGFRASAGAEGRIEEMGSWPWGMEFVRLNIRLRGGDWGKSSVVALDANGYERDLKIEANIEENGSAMSFRPEVDSIYHLIKR